MRVCSIPLYNENLNFCLIQYSIELVNIRLFLMHRDRKIEMMIGIGNQKKLYNMFASDVVMQE